MVTIDGSFGEGGGQILRSSLALAMVTGTPVRVVNIRAGRAKPGLMRQHLTAVHAAAQVCSARVEGAAIGSMQLTFEPGRVQPGDYLFSIGTAGSTTLVLQTVLPALLTAGGPTRVTLEGGTHNPFAPPFDFLDRAFLPIVNRMGPRVSAALERPGFYPAGGGRFSVDIEPVGKLTGIDLNDRGEIVRQQVRAIVAHLPRHIAEREIKVVRQRTCWPQDCFRVEEVGDAHGPGNVVMIEVESEHVTEVFTSFGQRGKPAETVAEEATAKCQQYLDAGVPVGLHLADQILLPLALAGRGSFRTLPLSSHSNTHLELIRQFLRVTVAVEKLGEQDFRVVVG